MTDSNDSNADAFLLATVLLLGREWSDDPEHWAFVTRRLIERVVRRRPEWGPDVEIMMHELLMRPPRFGRLREQMREVALDVVHGYRRSSEDELTGRLAAIEQRLDEADDTHARDASELHSFMWAVASGVDLKRAKLVRYVPVRIYVGNPVPDEPALEAIGDAFHTLADAMTLERAEELPAQSGSWWKRFFRKTREAVNDDDVKPTFDRAKAALEMKYLDRPQAEVTGVLADAAAKLIAALASVSGPCCGQVGSLLIVKLPGVDGKPSMVFKTLTPMELRRLEENAAMLQRPTDILGWLAKACSPALSLPDTRTPTLLEDDDDEIRKALPDG